MAEDPSTLESYVIPPVSGSNALVAPKRAPTLSTSFINEVEMAADYHVPAVYSLLNFYGNYEPQTDDNTSFIPVTSAKPNPKLFVVGVMPPDVNITGRLLDRSASLGEVALEPELMDQPEGRDVSVGVVDDVVMPSGTGKKGADLPDTFWQKYTQMCDRLQVDPYELAAVLEKESRFNPAAQNPRLIVDPRSEPIAQGLCQFVRATATSKRIGMSPDEWNGFSLLSAEEQLPYVERFYQGKAAGKSKEDLNIITFGGYNNPDGSLYASKAAQDAWIAAHPEDAGKFRNPEKQDRAIQQNPNAARDGRILRETLAANLSPYPSEAIKSRLAAARQYLDTYRPLENPDAAMENASNPNWIGEGRDNAQASKEEQAKTAEFRNAARAELGRKYQAAQAAEIEATRRAIEAMSNAPPLRFLVNPQRFAIRSEKVVADGDWTRNGPIVEHWGENQDKIEASGKVAAFFAIDANSPNPDAQGEGPGLTRGARQYSAGYQNFLSLFLLYRNNANVYTYGLDLPNSRGTFLSRLSMVGSMYIFYDDTLYLGSFDSFNITESETSPYTLEYSFEFTVRATFLLDRPSVYTPEAWNFIRGTGGAMSTTSGVPLLEDSEVTSP